MKNKILKTLSIAALLIANMAFAATITPENGWWWNPAASGRGFNIETQNNTVFVATFVYDQAGHPIWYSGSGQLDDNSTLTTHLMISEGGPCIGCPYQAPTITDAGIPITLQFTSREQGSISWQGETVPIQRFNFQFGKEVQKLLGRWMLIQYNEGAGNLIYGGNQVILNEITAGGEVSGLIDNKIISGLSVTPPVLTLGEKRKVIGGKTDAVSQFTYYLMWVWGSHIYTYVFNFDGLNYINGWTRRDSTSFYNGSIYNDSTIVAAILAKMDRDIRYTGDLPAIFSFRGYRVH
jgi:hypothetical protein